MASPATPLPPVIFEDGLGQRRRVVGARNQTLSVLFLDGELTADPAFEDALRERIAQLAGFHHDAFARARGVVHVTKTPLRLALASDFVEGWRLSEMLALADERLIPLEITAAYSVIHQLAAALAALHEHAETSHGALAPERIIVTADGRVVISEYVLGSALETLRFSPQRYWKELRIPLSHSGSASHFDQRADVIQLGAIALALIVGRPLRDDEFPARLSEIIDSVRAISATGLEPLPPPVRSWLRRALQLDARASFTSAADAFAELDGVLDVDDRTARQTLMSFAATCGNTLAQEEAQSEENRRPHAMPAPPARVVETREERMPELRIVPRPESTGRLFTSLEEISKPAAPSADPRAEETEAHETARPHHTVTSRNPASTEPAWNAASAFAEAPADRSAFAAATAERSTEPSSPAPSGAEVKQESSWKDRLGRLRQHRVAVAVAVLLVLGSAGTLAARRYFAVTPTGTLIVNTNPTGVAVVIDGQHRGATPLTLDLTAGAHVLQIVSSDGHVRKIPVTIAQGREVAQFIELPTVAPAPADGQLQVRSEPAGARVTIDGQYRGVAPLTVEALTPGAHTVKLEDSSASVTQQVTIEAGLTASLVVPLTAPPAVPVAGSIVVQAPVEVQIYENQRLLGSSNSPQIAVPAGRHDVEIVNETLGYRVARTVQVTGGNTAVVRLEWPKGSLALNATPWADVWLNGERLGETPIGNVQVPIGAHRVVFRHPELGEQTHNITVTLNAPARVSADMRKR